MLEDTEYSDAEIKLFQSFAFTKKWDFKLFQPFPLYRVLAGNCFMDKLEGENVEALRRGIKALETCSPYRMTKEFDNLIEF